MANSIALAFYTIRVREKRTNQYVPLGKIGDGEDLLEFMDKFLKNLKGKQALDEEDQKVINLESVFKNEKRRELNGIMKTGEFGHISELVGARDGKKHYDRTKEDAELIPLYYLFLVPENAEKGIAAFQRFKNIGMYSAFRKELNIAFQDRFPAHILEMYALVTDKFIKRYMSEGRIKGMQFNQYGLPSDLADALKMSDSEAKHTSIQFSVRARRGNFLHPDMDVESLVKKDNKTARKLVEVTGVDYTNISLDMNINGRTRKISLDQSQKFRPYYDVTEEVEKGSNGHPKFDSIDSLTHEFLKDFLNPLSE